MEVDGLRDLESININHLRSPEQPEDLVGNIIVFKDSGFPFAVLSFRRVIIRLKPPITSAKKPAAEVMTGGVVTRFKKTIRGGIRSLGSIANEPDKRSASDTEPFTTRGIEILGITNSGLPLTIQIPRDGFGNIGILGEMKLEQFIIATRQCAAFERERARCPEQKTVAKPAA